MTVHTKLNSKEYHMDLIKRTLNPYLYDIIPKFNNNRNEIQYNAQDPKVNTWLLLKIKDYRTISNVGIAWVSKFEKYASIDKLYFAKMYRRQVLSIFTHPILEPQVLKRILWRTWVSTFSAGTKKSRPFRLRWTQISTWTSQKYYQTSAILSLMKCKNKQTLVRDSELICFRNSKRTLNLKSQKSASFLGSWKRNLTFWVTPSLKLLKRMILKLNCAILDSIRESLKGIVLLIIHSYTNNICENNQQFYYANYHNLK